MGLRVLFVVHYCLPVEIEDISRRPHTVCLLVSVSLY